jgi:hypothetical protein
MDIQTIKTSVDIYDVLDMYKIRYSVRGMEESIPCPFHVDKSPSCRIYPNVNKLHCYGECSRSFDVLDVVMGMEECTLKEAIKLIQEHFGVQELKSGYVTRFWKSLDAVNQRNAKKDRLDLAFSMGKAAISKMKGDPLRFGNLWAEYDKILLAIKDDEDNGTDNLRSWYARFVEFVEESM